MKSLIFFYTLIFAICYKTVNAQYTLFGIKNAGQNFELIGIDCNQDTIVALDTITLGYYAATFSSTYDPVNQKYYYSTGQKIFKFNVNTGVAEDTIDFSFIHPYYLNNIRYNEFDGFIYGIQQSIATLRNVFTKFDPATGTIIDTIHLPNFIDVGVHCKSVLNIAKQEYIIQGKSLTAINITNGTIRYSHLIDSTSFDAFNHIAINCKNEIIYGIINNPVQNQNYLATIDTSNGILTNINTSSLPVNYYSQNQSGSTIDESTDIFYYAALNGMLYGIDTQTGSLVYSHNFGPGFELLFLESSDQFNCSVAKVTTLDKYAISIFPNPTQSKIYFETGGQLIDKILLTDFQFQSVSYRNVNSTIDFSIDLENLRGGFYSVMCFSKENEIIYKSKIIKIE